MTTIQMSNGKGSTCTITLSSGATVTLTNGVGSVNASDVPSLLLMGWTVGEKEPWPAARVFHMAIPSSGSWPTSGVVTFPDGTTAAIASGIALIPNAWKNWATQMGWSPAPGYGAEQA